MFLEKLLPRSISVLLSAGLYKSYFFEWFTFYSKVKLASGTLHYHAKLFSSGSFLLKFKVVLLALMLLGVILPHIKNEFIMRISH